MVIIVKMRIISHQPYTKWASYLIDFDVTSLKHEFHIEKLSRIATIWNDLSW